MIFKLWTKFLSWTKNILSLTKLFCLGQIWFCPGQKIFCPGRWTGHKIIFTNHLNFNSFREKGVQDSDYIGFFSILCPVHLPEQNIFCPGQNQICPRQNDFVQDNTFFCPQLKDHFCSGETHFKPWTNLILSWMKNILSGQMDGAKVSK